ncbi:MAG: hypothetical protein KDA41_04120, partial [Planctomycetales bacterium]|nr:hypothetical protein [Planctomycetales bacterium]
DLLRDRFDSAALAALATFLLVFFITINLIGQFKAGSVILQSLLTDAPGFQASAGLLARSVSWAPLLKTASPGYLLCLFTFAAGVVLYTTYGGFRAVVWTDVMQGVVMVIGVVVMLPLAIYFAGGLPHASQQMGEMTPPAHVHLRIASPAPSATGMVLPEGIWLEIPSDGDQPRRLFRTDARSGIAVGETDAQLVVPTTGDAASVPAIEITTEHQLATIAADPAYAALTVQIDPDAKESRYAFGAGQRNVYLTAPGPSRTRDAGFLPLSMAVSFFLMWTFSGAGQPGNMVRQMAFHGSRTLRYGIVTLCVYFSLIYFPIVVIFCCARVLLPGWEIEPDRI